MECYPLEDKFLTVQLSSAVFNVLNFLLFDIILASIVFWLTADIAGLVNSASALQQLDNQLHAYNPPLVGVGLTCTRRRVFRVLALIRAIAMLGVLATNFLIEGASCGRLTNVERNVLVRADINPFENLGKVRDFALRRRSCMGRTDTEVYYGELHVGERCELDRALITTPIVYFGLDFVNRTIELPKNPCEFYTDDNATQHMHRYTCEGLGVIGCEVDTNYNSIPETCVGVVLADDHRSNKTGKIEYMCEGEGLLPFPNRTTDQVRCRMARNALTNDTSWVPLVNNKAKTLRDTIDAVYGAGVQKTSVRVVGTKPSETIEVAQLDSLYFWVLGAKLLLIVLLIVIDVSMRARGLVPAANNEFGLGSLLTQAARAPRVGEDDLPIEVNPDADERTHLLVQSNNGVIRAHSVRT